MEEVKQSLQETASKRRDTKTYRSDCRRDYKQTSKHRKFH